MVTLFETSTLALALEDIRWPMLGDEFFVTRSSICESFRIMWQSCQDRVYVPEIFCLMTQKGAPSKGGQRKKNAAGWNREALIEKRGRDKI